MKAKYAPRSIMGTTVYTGEMVHTNGKIYPIIVERFEYPYNDGYMFIAEVDTTRRTNFRLYTSVKGAIKAASVKDFS